MAGILMHTQKEVELNRVKWIEYEEKKKREKKEQEEKRLREQPEREERERQFAEMWATMQTFNK
jgi:phage portal protein BeeE